MKLVLPVRTRGVTAIGAAVIPAAALLALLLAGCGGGSSSNNIAKVGDQPITEQQYLSTIEKTSAGISTLNYLLVEKVITEEAQAKGCVPTDADIAKLVQDQEAKDPQSAKAIAQDRVGYLRAAKLQLALQNLLLKGVDLSPAKQQAWFSAHRSLFDLPARMSVTLLVFDNMKKAQDAEALLKKSSSPGDVAASLGDPTWPQNGKASPLETQDVFAQQFGQFGPATAKAVEQLFRPDVKTGYTTEPISNSYLNGKVLVLQLANKVAPQATTYAQNADAVRKYMGTEAYVKTNFKYTIPATAPRSQYEAMSSQVTNKLLQDLMTSYIKKGAIDIKDPKIRDSVLAGWTKPAQPAGSPGAGAPAGVPAAANPAGSASPDETASAASH
jgi:hypothetical protein